MVAQELSIQKSTVIHASRSRVWRAISSAPEFAAWFRVKIDTNQFVPGQKVQGVSEHPCAGGDPRFSFTVDRVEPEHTFCWRWTPGKLEGIENVTTLVTFELEDVAEGTRVTVVESGFDAISLENRAKALAMNTRGWEMQLEALSNYAGTQSE